MLLANTEMGNAHRVRFCPAWQQSRNLWKAMGVNLPVPDFYPCAEKTCEA